MKYQIIEYIDQNREKRYCITDDSSNRITANNFYVIEKYNFSSTLNINDIFESLRFNKIPRRCTSIPFSYKGIKDQKIRVILEFDSFINFTEKFPEYYI